MRKINVVAITLFKKRVRTPSYYWMIFAPLILGIVILFVNNYVEKLRLMKKRDLKIILKSVKKFLINYYRLTLRL